MSAICGLMFPYVAELPNVWEAALPLIVWVPLSSPVANAVEAVAADAPTTEAVTAAAAITFLSTAFPFWI
ncbi:hypothetical protein GCM10010349_55600 [Streptomyces flavofungini]|nr:hypothetical protein GCM10010349_55600 [Streptomyces flavofungini]